MGFDLLATEIAQFTLLFFVVVVDQCKGYFERVGILKQWVCVAVSKILQWKNLFLVELFFLCFCLFINFIVIKIFEYTVLVPRTSL